VRKNLIKISPKNMGQEGFEEKPPSVQFGWLLEGLFSMVFKPFQVVQIRS